jgi:hypothetical protein
MRVVIDSNALRTEELESWLAASGNHKAVLIDYAWMEIYKGNERVGLLESLKVLKKFPDQVLLLKGTKQISAMHAAAPGYANAMVQSKSKAAFSKTVAELDGVETADANAMAAIIDHGQVAKRHFQKIKNETYHFANYLSASEAVFGHGSTAQMRGKNPLSSEFVARFFDVVDGMYSRFLAKHPHRPKPSRGRHRFDHFTWRLALAYSLVTKRFIRHGSTLPAKNERKINEFTDAVFATYGTYFNGVMTSDTNLFNLYMEMEVILRQLGARVPTHYIEHPDTLALFEKPE